MRIEITGIGSELQGVGRADDGRVVFVPYTLPGETVDISICKNADRFLEGRVEQVVAPSPHRVTPMCPLYGQCGGCKTQHADYAASLALKQQVVKQTLRRIGALEEIEVRETLGAKYPWRYRNKGEYAIATDPVTRTPVIGLCEAGSHQLVPVGDCIIQSEASIQVLKAISQWMHICRIPAWDDPSGAGGLRYLVTRVSSSGDIMVVLCTTARQIPEFGRLSQSLQEATDGHVRSLYQLTLSPRPAHALDGRCRLLSGKAVLRERLMGLSFDISPQTFLQVNNHLTDTLYTEVLKAARLTGEEIVLDAYCGAGTISLALARQARRVIGVELNAQAIENARQNARRNRLEDCTEFYAGDAAEEVLRLLKGGFRPDVIVVDPPRKGVEARLLEAMELCAPQRMVYVSCHPGTLARDLKILLKSGRYQVDYAQPVDMFSQTEHVETVCLLSKHPSDQRSKAD